MNRDHYTFSTVFSTIFVVADIKLPFFFDSFWFSPGLAWMGATAHTVWPLLPTLMQALSRDKHVFKPPCSLEKGSIWSKSSVFSYFLLSLLGNCALVETLSTMHIAHSPSLTPPPPFVLASHSCNHCISHTNHLNMSGCAVASNGSLLSPSKIDFYDDPNDVAPISGPSIMLPIALSASMGTSSAATLDGYSTSHQPMVEGVCCTTHTSKPSAWVQDAADSLNNSVISGKHKWSNVSLNHHVAHKIVLDSDISDVKNLSDVPTPSLWVKAASDPDQTTDGDGTDTNKAKVAYQWTKEMGDEDCEVSLELWWPGMCIDTLKAQWHLH